MTYYFPELLPPGGIVASTLPYGKIVATVIVVVVLVVVVVVVVAVVVIVFI